MRIIFVRHGEPDYDNDCLTPNGVIQAKCTAERLSGENITAVYASPMGRAVQTASFTARDHGLDVETLDFMHEIDWGGIDGSELEFDGHPWTLAYRFLGEDPSSSWREHHYFKDNICTTYYDMISSKTDAFLEGYGLVRQNGFYRIVRPCSDTIAVFAHGGSGAVFLSHILGLPFPFVLASMPYGVCSVNIIDLSASDKDIAVPRIELFNDMGHLGNVKTETLRFEK